MLAIYAALILIHVLATIYFYLSGSHTLFINYLYNVSTTLFAVLPTIQGIDYLKRYPLLRPVLIPLVTSFIFFTIARFIWFYYFLTGVPIPFPGIADVFFVLYYPLTIAALFNLSQFTKLRWGNGSIFALAIILVLASLLIFSFNFTFLGAFTPLTALAYLYSLSDAALVALSVTILGRQIALGFNYLLLFPLGYVIMSLSDVLFGYASSIGAYWNGNFIDLLYVFAHGAIAIGVFFLPRILKNASVAEQ